MKDDYKTKKLLISDLEEFSSKSAKLESSKQILIEIEGSLNDMSTDLDYSMPGFSKLDKDGHYVSLNKSYTKMMSYETSELIGVSLEKTIHKDELGNASSSYKRC